MAQTFYLLNQLSTLKNGSDVLPVCEKIVGFINNLDFNQNDIQMIKLFDAGLEFECRSELHVAVHMRTLCKDVIDISKGNIENIKNVARILARHQAMEDKLVTNEELQEQVFIHLIVDVIDFLEKEYINKKE